MIESDLPHSRMTQLCEAMTEALEDHPEHDNERAIVLLEGSNGQHAGVLHGYEDDAEACHALLSYLKVLFENNGKRLVIAPIYGEG